MLNCDRFFLFFVWILRKGSLVFFPVINFPSDFAELILHSREILAVDLILLSGYFVYCMHGVSFLIPFLGCEISLDCVDE